MLLELNIYIVSKMFIKNTGKVTQWAVSSRSIAIHSETASTDYRTTNKHRNNRKSTNLSIIIVCFCFLFSVVRLAFAYVKDSKRQSTDAFDWHGKLVTVSRDIFGSVAISLHARSRQRNDVASSAVADQQFDNCKRWSNDMPRSDTAEYCSCCENRCAACESTHRTKTIWLCIGSKNKQTNKQLLPRTLIERRFFKPFNREKSIDVNRLYVIARTSRFVK